MYDIFYILLLEKDITKKKQVNDSNTVVQLELDEGKSKEYNIEAIYNSAVYAKKLEVEYLLGFYYIVS